MIIDQETKAREPPEDEETDIDKDERWETRTWHPPVLEAGYTFRSDSPATSITAPPGVLDVISARPRSHGQRTSAPGIRPDVSNKSPPQDCAPVGPLCWVVSQTTWWKRSFAGVEGLQPAPALARALLLSTTEGASEDTPELCHTDGRISS